MNVEVELPDLGSGGGDQATVIKWHFEEGDFVEEGEALPEVLCETGTVEVPCSRSGVLVERLVEQEDIVRVGEPVALLEVREEEEEIEQAE